MANKRTRIILEFDDRTKWALRFQALNMDVSSSEVVRLALEAFMPEEFKEAAKRFPDEGGTPRPKRGRPPK